MIMHVKSNGGTNRELTFEAVSNGIIAIGYVENVAEPSIVRYLHVDAYALRMAVQSTERIAQEID